MKPLRWWRSGASPRAFWDDFLCRVKPCLGWRHAPIHYETFASFGESGIVRNVHTGRESLFAFQPEPLKGVKQYLDLVSEEWDQALARLKFL